MAENFNFTKYEVLLTVLLLLATLGVYFNYMKTSSYLYSRYVLETQVHHVIMDDGFVKSSVLKPVWDLYVVSAYYYAQSESLGNNSMALVLSGDWSNEVKTINLTAWSGNYSKIVSFPLEKVLENVTNAHVCKWNSYFATAITIPNLDRITVRSNGNDKEIPFKLPVQEKYDVVTCIAPIFTMEQWQEMLFALHVYKQFGSHVHLHVRSMLTSVYKVLEFYEKEKYVTVQPWSRLGLQTVSSKLFNPNYWVEFRAQDAAQTDCLQQYKESATFISFMDLDDIIFPKQGKNYFEEFSHLFQEQPTVKYFRYQKWNTRYKITRDPKLFSVNRMIESLQSASKTEYGKYVTKPTYANSSWIHWPTHSKYMEWRNISAKYTTIVHLKGVEENDEYFTSNKSARLPRFNLTAFPSPYWDHRKMKNKLMLTRKNLNAISEEYDRMLNLQGMRNVLENLPRTPFYGPLISECYNRIFYSIPWDSHVGWQCTNPDRCDLPKNPGIRCTNARAKYRSIRSDANINFHFSTERWLADEDGCVP